MTDIAVSIQNRLLSEAVCSSLKKTGEFRPAEISSGRSGSILPEILALKPGIVLMEVSYAPDGSLSGRLETVREIRRKLPSCKIALICDERSSPDIARGVMIARQDGLIDQFFYTSVTSDYMIASLTSMLGDISRTRA